MKKLHFYFLFLTILSFAFISCDNNNDDDSEIKFISNSGEDITSLFVTSIDHASVTVINLNGSFSFQSSNEEIATVDVVYDGSREGLTIQIQGHKKGNTIITITDSENKTAKLEVTVYDKELAFTITEHFTLVDVEKGHENDQKVIDQITKEITEKLAPVGGRFVMTYTDDQKGNLVYYPDIKDMEKKSEGTFEIRSEDSGTHFIFNYNELEYKYRFESVGGGGFKSSPPISYIYLVLDFTDDYKDITQPKIMKAEGALKVKVN